MDYDVIVIGSGFGGSVAALRLTEKNYRVGVLEAGRRFSDATLPKSSWDIRRFLWAPRLGLRGIQRIHVLKDVVILAGAGVGGGSLVYGNTLYEPTQAFFDDPQWRHLTDWKDELAPFYALARRMLGVVVQPSLTAADRALRAVAEEMGSQDSFGPTSVGVFFGPKSEKRPGETFEDPFFGGIGPARKGCIECGDCMIGCRHGAKNRLDLNYLALAEQGGAVIHPDTTVVDVRPEPTGGYRVSSRRSGSWSRREDLVLRAEHVVFAAGTWGTQQLLHKLRDDGSLPNISPMLGHLTRTNSESLLGATARKRDVDYSNGVAITSSWYPTPDTHIEPVRYGRGSNLMGLLSAPLTDGGPGAPRWIRALSILLRRPRQIGRFLSVRHWSERTIIALVMQSIDNSIIVQRKRSILGTKRLTSKQGHGASNPSWIPIANEAVRRLAHVIGGDPGGTLGDLVNIPMTAHFIGGCSIGESRDKGVIDPYHRVFGHPGLHVVDGSALSANLGVNPSLTITAQAERALAMWPNRGQDDHRPALGKPYARVAPVFPERPIVPPNAPGALSFDLPDQGAKPRSAM